MLSFVFFNCKDDAIHYHQWEEWAVINAPTCEETGYGTRICSLCGMEDDNRTIPALGHNWDSWTIINPIIYSLTSVEVKRTCPHAHTETFIGTFKECLSKLTGSTADEPFTFVINTNELQDNALNNIYSYVNLDFSGSTFTSMDSNAFSYSRGLVSINLPSSVTGNLSSFYTCENLTSISVNINNPTYSSVDGVLYNKDKTTLIEYPHGKKDDTFIIPDSVTRIGAYSFGNIRNLTSIAIPDSVTNVDSAFQNTNLMSISVNTNNPAFSSVDGVLYNKDKTRLIRYPPRKKNNNFTIPNSVIEIWDHAFSSCRNLTSVTMLNSVTEIYSFAFSDCSSLISVTIPNSVTYISQGVFYNCSFSSIHIPSSVYYIGYNAFRCYNLTSVNFAGTISSTHYYFGDAFPGLDAESFPGDLCDKFYAIDKTNGTPGTYTRPNGNSNTWTKQ